MRDAAAARTGPGRPRLPPLARPEIYHGENMDGYAIVDTRQTELSTDDVTTKYEGESGVAAGSLPRRAAFALRCSRLTGSACC